LSSWAFAYRCCPLLTGRFSSSAGQTRAQVGGVTRELLTLPRPFSAVRCRPSMQVDGLCLSARVAPERHVSERLAVNLAVNPLFRVINRTMQPTQSSLWLRICAQEARAHS
jgi:hypothetical protein